jgi:hypothetical protein
VDIYSITYGVEDLGEAYVNEPVHNHMGRTLNITGLYIVMPNATMEVRTYVLHICKYPAASE